MNITMDNICVTIDKKTILHNVSLTLNKQELVMLLGLNGSGKTTLMRTLLGVNKPQSGRISLGDRDLLGMSEKERSKYLSYVPQSMHGDVNYSVEEYVLLGITPTMNYFQVPGRKEVEKVHEVLQKFGIYDKRKQNLLSLSGGERQLTSLARARIQETPWMVLDEPLANLDYVRQHEFIHRLVQYQEEYKQGIFMSVHDPNIALKYADTVVVLHNHKIADVLRRSDPLFEEELMTVLNELYEAHLGLLTEKGNSLYYWKE